MDDPDKVSAFVRAGREAAIVAPTYLFHCAHLCEVICPGETVVDLKRVGRLPSWAWWLR